MSCSCPSGDGSLRWPCSDHPPSLDAVAVQLDAVQLDAVCRQLDAVMRELAAALQAALQPLAELQRELQAAAQQPVALSWVDDELLRDRAAGQSIGTFDQILTGCRPADAPPAGAIAQQLIPGRRPIARHALR